MALNYFLDGTELEDIIFDNGCLYGDLFLKYKENSEVLFYLLSILFKEASNEVPFPSDMSIERYANTLVKLSRMFNRFELGYIWDEEKQKIEHIVDEITASTINNNIDEISKTQSKGNRDDYINCIDDFIGVNFKSVNNKQYYEALGRMKKVWERTIGKILKKNGKTVKISNIETILNSIFKDTGKNLESQRESLKFIIENIHHDQEDDSGSPTAYTFNREEFEYWWLEMNNFIYLLNKSNARS